MKYLDLSGLKISNVTLGTVQLGLDYGINNASGRPSQEKAGQILSAALEGGITAFDTSSAYGTSEKVLGDYFKHCANEKPTIVTKFSIMNHDNPLSKAQAERRIIEQVENSLALLNYDSLPLLLVHNEYDLDVYGQTLISTLKRLKNQGVIKRLGVSLNHFSYIDKVIESQIFEAVQLPLNMMDVKNSTSGSLTRLEKEGFFVFVRSVFLQGLFFRDPDTLPEGILQMAKEPLKKVRKIAEEENVSIAELAIAYIRGLSGVHSLVLGAENVEQVKQNINLSNVKELSEKARERVVEAFKDVDERVLRPWLWAK